MTGASEFPPEEPQEYVPTEEEMAQMRAATPAEAQAVDELILAQCSERFRKVAMVAAKLLREFEAQFPHLPLAYVLARMQELEKAGAIEIAGDVWYMRHSEIRLVSRASEA
jgi:hypothetical protein